MDCKYEDCKYGKKQLLLREWIDIVHAIASVNQKHSGRTQIKSKFDGTFIRLGARASLCLLSVEKTKYSFWTETVASLETVHLTDFLLFSCIQNGLKTLPTWNKIAKILSELISNFTVKSGLHSNLKNT